MDAINNCVPRACTWWFKENHFVNTSIEFIMIYYTECWLKTSSRLRWVSKQSRSSEYLSLYFVLTISNAHTTPVRVYGEPYAHGIYVEYNPSSSNITRCQVPLRVRTWFHHSAGDIDFYKMSLSQWESTILHESIILNFIDCISQISSLKMEMHVLPLMIWNHLWQSLQQSIYRFTVWWVTIHCY